MKQTLEAFVIECPTNLHNLLTAYTERLRLYFLKGPTSIVLNSKNK